nr:uncharacterized protein LOC109187360 [Ipomoea trifida]
MSSPTATSRLPEEQDLLQRSTKKSKRNQGSMENNTLVPLEEIVQEMPKEQNEPVEMEYDSNGDIVNGSKKDSKCPIISVTKEEKERLRRPWRRSLIIKLLGRKVSYCYLLQKLKRMWNLDASFELIALDQDLFLAKFESLRDYDYAKFLGPWVIMDHCLVLQE